MLMRGHMHPYRAWSCSLLAARSAPGPGSRTSGHHVYLIPLFSSQFHRNYNRINKHFINEYKPVPICAAQTSTHVPQTAQARAQHQIASCAEGIVSICQHFLTKYFNNNNKKNLYFFAQASKNTQYVTDKTKNKTSGPNSLRTFL